MRQRGDIHLAMGQEDQVSEEDDPALEIVQVFSAAIPQQYLECSSRNQQHGPKRARVNHLRCATHSSRTGGVILGLELGDVLHWSLGGARPRRIDRVGKHKGSVSSAVVSGESNICGGLILTGSADATVKIWDFKGAQREGTVCVQTLYGHGGTVTAVAVVGECIVSGSTDRSIRVWRAAQGRKSLTYPWFEAEVGISDGCCWPVGRPHGLTETCGAISSDTVSPPESLRVASRRMFGNVCSGV